MDQGPTPFAAPTDRRLALEDSFGRRFEYLRLSLTDRCNFRCSYCLPQGYRKDASLPPELSRHELRRAVAGFARLGLWKLRLTGGEPTVRSDFEAIARDLSGVEGIRRIAMTTNGYRLTERAETWREAGVHAVNVSIDTLDRENFARVTGHDRLPQIVEGVDAALDAGFDAVKVNSVLMRSLEPEGWDKLLGFIAARPVSWRFIELMRTNDNAGFHRLQATAGDAIAEKLRQGGWTPLDRATGSGPAVEYAHPGFAGRIGLIAPYSPGFCDSCNRLRLSSRGKLHLCLFGEHGVDLRDLLQEDRQQDDLVARILAALPAKPRAHRLHEGSSGSTPHLASIGG
ncbi:GTP 3',8-cyclase MoaA [Qipengyuania sp. 6B39]|uniref:GTP 3',8-cyclase MoaA n=1 Tax=Qipengyuania proteolytica TaxID=2867239 RepID=UPI001C894611|nr:GTP 3',8-cyclase MoaA [Qipengyuania proteolytica]MBX7495108.1 GTP 3',8-cyclase MoaA [Qipengyuania proteolytica]